MEQLQPGRNSVTAHPSDQSEHRAGATGTAQLRPSAKLGAAILVGLIAAVVALGTVAGPLAAQVATERARAILVIESSESMANDLSGVRAFVAMGNALAANFVTFDGSIDMGLDVMGQDACTEPRTMRPVGPLEALAFAKPVSALRPAGQAALTPALLAAARRLGGEAAGSRSLIVIGTGADSCSPTPCAVSDELARDHPGLEVHTIAFPSGGADNTALACIARATGGLYRAAGTQSELAAALNAVFTRALARRDDESAASAAWGTAVVAPPKSAAANWDVRTNQTATEPVPQAPATPAAAPARTLQLRAILNEGGPQIPSGLVWRVFSAGSNASALNLVATAKEATPRFALPPGDYLVNASYGRAHVTKPLKVALADGSPLELELVLNAGGLRVNAVATDGKPIRERRMTFDVYLDERNQSGERPLLLSDVAGGLIVRLNSGLYHVVSRLGDANATVAADVSVEAGKLTEVTFSHNGGRITFKLVQTPGGEALADTRWRIVDAAGELVKETAGALPTHILAPGSYTVTAIRGEQSYQRTFTVAADAVGEVEVVASQ
ncbi:MAG: hypothetical protein GC150_05310 [Rhizobiales bacterium]|nr:hypothetical protein [Hyphomicrobiales bacterium]